MKFNFKERLQNINKTRVALISGILFVIALCSVFGYEYFKMRQFENISAKQAPMESVLVQGQQEVEAQPLKPSQYNIGIDYDKAMKSDKPVVVLFYADWCRFCIGFMPTYQSLSNIYKDDYNFSKINVEDPKYEQLVKESGITGFPTVFLLDPKYDNKVLLSNALFSDMKKIRVELDRFLRIHNMLNKK